MRPAFSIYDLLNIKEWAESESLGMIEVTVVLFIAALIKKTI